MSRAGKWAAVTLILLLAAALRLWALGDVPPGLAHDEVANWLIARDILAGNHALYFTAAYGHEPLYQYVQAATVALFGDHWLGLRWPSVAFGLLGVAVTYVLIRRLFGLPVALLTSAWLAGSFWPLFYARVALRAVTLPFTAALSAYFLLRATGRDAKSGLIDWLLAGLFLGISVYTYMAARILPLILLAYLFYLYLVRPSLPWPRVLAFLLTAALVAAPLVIWLATHPQAESRIGQVREPLERLLAGDPSAVWHNLVANLKFFTITGDPFPRQGIPGRPVFADPLGGALFYAGVLLALWRWRDPRYGFLLIWLLGALIPSIVTADAPSSIRDILGLVVVFAFPASATIEICRRVGRRMRDKEREIRARGILLPLVCLLLLLPGLLLTVRDYFVRWPQHDVVRFDYQADLTAVAHRLDELPPETPVAVAGLSVHSLDGPGLELATRRDAHAVRLCDTRETLLLPTGAGDESEAWLFVPRVVPLDADLRERLLRWGAAVEIGSPSSFTAYRLPGDAASHRALQRLLAQASLPDGAEITLPVSFGGRLAFLGYEWLSPSDISSEAAAGTLSPAEAGDGALLTYWRVEVPSGPTLKVFVHLLDEAGQVIAQHDGLGSPPEGWSSGDLIVQKHVLPLPADLPPGRYTPVVGLYRAREPTLRLAVDGSDRLLLPPI